MELNYQYPLLKLPKETELTLCLIREQLKITKFFSSLRQAGLDDCYYEPHLDTIILACIGFEEVCDELMEFYVSLLEKYSADLEPDREQITENALKMYEELKRRLNN